MSAESATSIEKTDTFGNYLIHGIDEIILPETIAWWPLAPGWKVLGLIALTLLILRCARWVKIWWHNRYRREALRQLHEKAQGNELQDVVAWLPYYLKVTALQAYPRRQIASMTGTDWLEFLDNHYSGPSFSGSVGQKLLAVAYQPREQWHLDEEQSRALIKMSRRWIATHRQAQDV